MSLKTVVKVSHISSLSDARYCAGMGVEMLGIGVNPSGAHYMAPEVFHEIRGWISGPKIVAEVYGLSSAEDLESIVRTYAPDYFEMTLQEYERLSPLITLPAIVYLPGGLTPPSATIKKNNVSHIIVDEHVRCAGLSTPVPVMTKISSVESLGTKVAEKCFSGVVLEGPGESRPGITSYDHLGALLEALEDV